MLKIRIVTAVLLLVFMLVALFIFPAPAWAGVVSVMMGLALWEFTRMTRLNGVLRWGYLAISAGLATLAWWYRLQMPLAAHVLVLLFWLVGVPCWLAKQWRLTHVIPAALVGWALVWPAWFALLEWRSQPENALTLSAVMALVWIADIAAYFVGKTWGRHKLAPSISPGKSWEGVYGALVCAVLYAVLAVTLGWIQLPLPLWFVVLLSPLLAAVSIMGDLLESWFKRTAGMKGSSTLLPGHGGVYDRIDSLIAVLAVSNALRVLGSF